MKNDELERVKKLWWRNQGTIPAHAWRNRRQSQNSSVRIAGVQTEIRTENLPNGSLQRYIEINLFGENDEIKSG
jgi:hypothetical protein